MSAMTAADFIDWLDRTSWDVLPGIAARPQPTLTVDGQRGVISGLRFQHHFRCWKCRETTYVYTDGGTITAGLETYGPGRRKVRWFQEHHAGGYPPLPQKCPNPACGATDRPFSYTDYGFVDACGPEPMELLNVVWSTLRTAYPDEVAEADTVDCRYAPAQAHPRHRPVTTR